MFCDNVKSCNLNYLIVPSQILCEVQNTEKQCYIWFSGNFGTWFLRVPKSYIVIKKKNFIFLKQLTNNLPSKIYNSKLRYQTNSLKTKLLYLQFLIITVSSGFRKFLKIRGRSCYWISPQTTVEFEKEHFLQAEVRLSHTIKFRGWNKLHYHISPKRKKIRFRAKNINMLSNYVFLVRKKRVPNYISGKGIRFLKDIAQNPRRRKKII